VFHQLYYVEDRTLADIQLISTAAAAAATAAAAAAQSLK